MSYKIRGRVVDFSGQRPVQGAKVTITPKGHEQPKYVTYSHKDGKFSFSFEGLESEDYSIRAVAFGKHSDDEDVPNSEKEIELKLPIDVHANIINPEECSEIEKDCPSPIANKAYLLKVEALEDLNHVRAVEWSRHPDSDIQPTGLGTALITFFPTLPSRVSRNIEFTLVADHWPEKPEISPSYVKSRSANVMPAPVPQVSRVALQRSAVRPTREENLWTLIRANAKALHFERYRAFINKVLCGKRGQHKDVPEGLRLDRERSELSPNVGVGAYELLRTATDLFLLLHCRTHGDRQMHGEEFFLEETSRRQNSTTGDLTQFADQFLGANNPYVRQVIAAAFPDEQLVGDVQDGLLLNDGLVLRDEPCLIELIWSYWHEEGMLTQSVNALSRRFQNRAAGIRDPLSHFELDPLRPLNNVLWGYAQEEYRRLTIPRRSLEYCHQYGLTLLGKANPRVRAADPRSNFLESFHNLLHRCSQFFKEDNDTTVIADGFPLLNALKEVHLVLSQGAHNQFGDLPWTARAEMLIQQWIMGRGEIRDFLQSRAMVRYTEAWMPQVDTMKTLQGWTDVTVERFHDLASYGEQILLSIRWGDWVNINDEDVAKNWARYWRPEIQSYLHSYRAVTGVEIATAEKVDFTLPAVHLQRRLEAQMQAR
ncbi:MAG: hypothetical protein JWP08_582 [Bryobacterales bacterium]|nr:hypothetical protein [Bryobacterales bacterium]